MKICPKCGGYVQDHEPKCPSCQTLFQTGASNLKMGMILQIVVLLLLSAGVILGTVLSPVSASVEKDSEDKEDSQEAGGNDRLSVYVSNAKIETANDNAATIYRSATAIAGNAMAEGTPISSGWYGMSNGQTFSSSDDTDFIYDVLDLLDSSSADSSWAVYIDDGTVILAYYGKTSEDHYIGGYPTQAEGTCDGSFETVYFSGSPSSYEIEDGDWAPEKIFY